MGEGIASDYAIDVVWEGGMRYQGGPSGGAMMLLDGERQVAPSPVDAVLVALASCSAIDLVEILNKRRTPPTDVRVVVEFSRAAESPKRVTRVLLHFQVTAASERVHVERAIALSFEKYCSVSASFAPDTAIRWDLELKCEGVAGESA
ncbi:OsmC family protein [soil metagenome]